MNQQSTSHILSIAIIGRPNVGKSTLFNRLFGRRRALVHDIAGVTRDRLDQIGEWKMAGGRQHFRLIDTGGVGEGPFEQEIKVQVIKFRRILTLDVVPPVTNTMLLVEDCTSWAQE